MIRFIQRTVLCFVGLALGAVNVSAAEERQALFGDLHVHTRLSLDAWGFGTRTSPDDAYRFAKGAAIPHPSGYEIQLDRPLDFYAVTDHANFIGMLDAMADPESPMSKIPGADRFTQEKATYKKRRADYAGQRQFVIEHLDLDIKRAAWARVVDAANRHNDPGRFTAFIGYEYTSHPRANLHRNVIFRGSEAPGLPFSRIESQNPEALWAWMDELRERGIESLAIPHNSNGSNGRMFEITTYDGNPLDRTYAETRMRNEPLVEITQVKGTSDTHPFLSPEDEWADFEIMPYVVALWLRSQPVGSYVRNAYLRGIKLEDSVGFNPYRFGVVAASDTHVSGGSFDESNFHSKIGQFDGTPQVRGSVPVSSATDDVPAGYAETYYRLWSASGLAGVWAAENTRDAIYDAFRRKETFGTTGTRIKVRFFAGYDFPDDLASNPDAVALAYAGGVSMGADLLAQRRGEPKFFVWAARDPRAAALQRLQVIMGWVDDGVTHEQVYDVACSDGGNVDPKTHRCPDNGAKVDISNCAITPDLGAGELKALWTDPDFDRRERAFYYVRVLENPTCRWSTWDAIKAGVARRPDLPATIQERAWSSPIWIEPR
ncbi:MAG: DUF3604 domain-containing protein [Gammaproteobacteria bacterium]|nr:DUF3604 domain-containing protein [Gammaproteobacteria bacterium]